MSRTEGFLVEERPNGTLRVRRVNDEPEVTKQSFRDECDINNIISQYKATGVLRHLNSAEARFADVTELRDFSEAMVMVKAAEEVFMELPSSARKVFNHDPAAFLDAAHDPQKRDLLVEAGLVAPLEAPVVPPTPSEVPASPEPQGE